MIWIICSIIRMHSRGSRYLQSDYHFKEHLTLLSLWSHSWRSAWITNSWVPHWWKWLMTSESILSREHKSSRHSHIILTRLWPLSFQLSMVCSSKQGPYLFFSMGSYGSFPIYRLWGSWNVGSSPLPQQNGIQQFSLLIHYVLAIKWVL